LEEKNGRRSHNPRSAIRNLPSKKETQTMIRRCVVLLAALAVGLMMTAGHVSAQGKKSDSVVKAKATADKPVDGKQVVTITLDIDPQYYIYANPPGQEDLASAQTEVKVTGKNKPETVKIEYPEPKVEKDTTLGDYKVYRGKVTIKATVQRAKGDTGALEVAIKLQSCSKKSCLAPATIKLAVP
jgi:thiol:disulfide interchange protein